MLYSYVHSPPGGIIEPAPTPVMMLTGDPSCFMDHSHSYEHGNYESDYDYLLL